MAAYLIANIEIVDAGAFENYRGKVPATIAAYGGKYLVKGGKFAVLEGDWVPNRVIVLEFPSMVDLKRWYESPDYKPLLELRAAATNSSIVVVEGV